VATLVVNTVQISTDGLPPLRYTEQRGSEYRRGEGGGDADGWALVVARPVPSSIHLALYLNGIDPCGRQVPTPQLLMDRALAP